jgi:DNA (cytosine-5)-methyltransferase 1
MAAYYNENDPFAAAWLRELIKRGLIADGEVDDRSIADVQADDVRGFVQCHFFAGIGGWSYALRLAGWPDDRPVWTGSCPCQPFSSAGSRQGGADHRHLWPYWARLISECRPITIFGEQVESAIAHGWIDLVFDDLEREGYSCGPSCLPAASVGAFTERQRLWFVVESGRRERRERWSVSRGTHPSRPHTKSSRSSDVSVLADTNGRECRQGIATAEHAEESVAMRRTVGHSSGARLQGLGIQDIRGARGRGERRGPAGAGIWDNAVWIQCRDGKHRPVEPEIFPLATGIPNRVGVLRGSGNSIVPQVAAAFIEAYLDICDGVTR